MMNMDKEIRIDADFPGGNIVLDDIQEDTVFLHQDLRDTTTDWFYWCFRVSGGEGRTLAFHFTSGDVIGARGPAVSLDQGVTWRWLGRETEEPRFTYTFPDDRKEIRFSFGMPYQESTLNAFLQTHSGHPNLLLEEHCKTKKGRSVERLLAGCVNSEPKHRVLITARHHCCEMMANYALEGILDSALGECETGKWFRDNVAICAIPFMDKDGVEDGDQGKNRNPYDHNRDYDGDSIYQSVYALRKFAPTWSYGKLQIAMDLHCPHIRGDTNEKIYLVGSPDADIWNEQIRFSQFLESVVSGYLPFSADDIISYGQGWNTDPEGETRPSFANWAGNIPGVLLASTIEIPYATAKGAEVNQQTSREFGRDLARAIQRYLVV